MRIRGVPMVPLSTEDWATFLAAIGFRGPAWRDSTNRWWAFLRGLAPEFGRVHTSLIQLVNDLTLNDPTSAWVTWWEEALDLPEDDFPVPATLADRIVAVKQGLARARWGQSKPFYVALAALLGASVDIDTLTDRIRTFRVLSLDGAWVPARMGACEMGTAVMGGTITATGEKVQRVINRRKRLASRVIYTD